MIRIDRPLLLKTGPQDCTVEMLLFVSQSNELFYFNESDRKELGARKIILNKLDLLTGSNKGVNQSTEDPKTTLSVLVTDTILEYLLRMALGGGSQPCTALPQLIVQDHK